VAKIDKTKEADLVKRFVSSNETPFVFVFKAGKENKKDNSAGRYNTEFEVDKMKKYSIIMLGKEKVENPNKPKQAVEPAPAAVGDFTDKDVVVLTAATFDETVSNSEGIWMIEFYAPWCGHCKKLEPKWNEAATLLKGKVNFAKADMTLDENKPFKDRFGISGFPSLFFWEAGSDKKADD